MFIRLKMIILLLKLPMVLIGVASPDSAKRRRSCQQKIGKKALVTDPWYNVFFLDIQAYAFLYLRRKRRVFINQYYEAI